MQSSLKLASMPEPTEPKLTIAPEISNPISPNPDAVVDTFSTNLPTELQCRIFDLAVHGVKSATKDSGHQLEADQDTDTTAIRLATINSVCRSWRNTALDCPFLWNEIDLFNPRFAGLCLERSVNCPLSIVFDISSLDSKHSYSGVMRIGWFPQRLPVSDELNDDEEWRPIQHLLERDSSKVSSVSFVLEEFSCGKILTTFFQREFPSLLRLKCEGVPKNRPFFGSMALGHGMLLMLALGDERHNGGSNMFKNLRAPRLQELELNMNRFQRFSFPMTELRRVTIGPAVLFNNSTFRDLRLWLGELPQLTHLIVDSCKLLPPPDPSGPSIIAALSQININPICNDQVLYFTSHLRYLRIVQEEKRFDVPLELLQMLDPFLHADCAIDIDFTLSSDFFEEDSRSLCRDDSDYFQVIQRTIGSRNNSTALSTEYKSGENTSYLGVSVEQHASPAFSSFPTPTVVAFTSFTGASYGSGTSSPSSSFYLRSHAASGPSIDCLNSLSGLLFQHADALSIPTITQCSIDYSQPLHGVDWAPFLARHPSIQDLKVIVPCCTALFSALRERLQEELQGVAQERHDSGDKGVDPELELIERIVLVHPHDQFLAAEKHWLTSDPWKALIEYASVRFQLGRPLQELRLCGCEGLAEKDLDELRALVGDGGVVLEQLCAKKVGFP